MVLDALQTNNALPTEINMAEGEIITYTCVAYNIDFIVKW